MRKKVKKPQKYSVDSCSFYMSNAGYAYIFTYKQTL